MAVRRMGLELVFNLQWKNKPVNGGDKANVIGMYDIPTTTQNFEVFKSYLLKNSGVALNDVKVTYITDNDGEWVIENQTCFEIALCAFRLKARLGEVIFLKLDKLSDAKSISNIKMMKKPSFDGQTQYDAHDVAGAAPNNNNNNNISADNIPPQWFLDYMANLKKELVDEVTVSVSNIVLNNNNNNNKPAEVIPQPIPKWKKHGRMEERKSPRTNKHLADPNISIDKEVIRSLKLERKLDCKLDKLDAKIKKTLEKKKFLKTFEMAAAGSTSKQEPPSQQQQQQQSQQEPDEEEAAAAAALVTENDAPILMNASLVNEVMMKPHMLGGERYLHTWEVINNGKLQWTSDVELRLTWGSVDMTPAVKNIPVPKLNPGEIGYISVLFQIPKKPGQYESYWNFFEKDNRFGQSVSFCVIVDPPSNCFDDIFNKVTKQENIENAAKSCPNELLLNSLDGSFIGYQASNNKPVTVDAKPDLIDDCSDSDNQSGFSSADDSKKLDEFIVIPVPSGQYKLSKEDEQELAIDLSKHLKLTKITDDDVNVKENLQQQQQQKQQQKPELQQLQHEMQPKIDRKDYEPIVDKNEPENDTNNNNNNGSSATSSESICKIDEEEPSEASGYNMVALVASDDEDEEYVYIEVKGEKVLLPKNILHPKFIEAAKNFEEKTSPILEQEQNENGSNVDIDGKLINPNGMESYVSHCSTTGTCFSDVNSHLNSFTKSSEASRHFVFPHNNPGFEIIYPMYNQMQQMPLAPPTTSYTPTGCFFACSTTPPPPPPALFKEMSPMDQGHPLNTLNSLPDTMPTYTWAQSKTKYTTADIPKPTAEPIPGFIPKVEQQYQQTVINAVPNFQQTPKEEQKVPQYVPDESVITSAPKPSISSDPQATTSAPQKTTPPPPPPSTITTTTTTTTSQETAQVHILPENLVSGAVNVASSALNTARSVINMLTPPSTRSSDASTAGGTWMNGHWITNDPNSKRAKNLRKLNEMGFWDTDLNASLLARYNDDLNRVVTELI